MRYSTLRNLVRGSFSLSYGNSQQIKVRQKPVMQNLMIRFMSKDSEQVEPLSIKSKNKSLTESDLSESIPFSETKTIEFFDRSKLFSIPY